MWQWAKSKIGEHSSDTAIQHGNYVIARMVTYKLNVRIERFLLSYVGTYPHKTIKWFDDAETAKKYCEKNYDK